MPKLYHFAHLNEIASGKVISELDLNDEVSEIAYDSRAINYPALTVFFAIRSGKNDGHKYIRECYEKGVRNFFIEDKDVLNSNPFLKGKCNISLIKSAVKAMQDIAVFHRNRYDIPVIGITGSNGKTVAKEWLFQLIQAEYKIVRSPKSYNSQIGVPVSVWQLNEDHQLGIFEAGISEPGEMSALEKMINPTIGVFTNIGEAHQSQFESLEQKIAEKLKLFKNCNVLVYCTDYKLISQEISEALKKRNLNRDIELLGWGTSKNSEISLMPSGDMLQLSGKLGDYEFTIPFKDKASIENISHCIVLMRHLGYEADTINSRIRQLQPVEMRLELKAGINSCTLINDSYNSDIVSLAIAIDTLNQQKQHKRKTIILSDILQSGRRFDELYQEVGMLIRNKKITRFIGIGSDINKNRNYFPEESLFFASTEQFLRDFDQDMFWDEAILIKGSRDFGFERISRRLQQKAHNTELHINLSAMIHNLNYYRSLLNSGTKVMAMVKAFSYGSGSFEIANVLQHQKIDYLGVAYADEGIYLRQRGMEVPVMVMNPEESAFDNIIQYKLEPEIFSFRLLDLFHKAIKNSTDSQKPFPVHLKIDTGMHRLGFMEEEIDKLVSELIAKPELKVISVFSHLASSDIPEHDDFTGEQIAVFEKVCDKISKGLKYSFIKHILNTSGVSRFRNAQFDMVRLGLGLYGIDSAINTDSPLENVCNLITHISQIKVVKKGESIGYSRKAIAQSDMKIAIIGIGYADGYSRILSNGKGKVYINGQLAPIVGNICMDMSMVDISNINCTEGDMVLVFGKSLPIEKVAYDMGTIPYEVLTNVSQRVKRVYFQE